MEANLESSLAEHREKLDEIYDYIKVFKNSDFICALLFRSGYTREDHFFLCEKISQLKEALK